MSKINYTPQQIEDLINNVYGGVVTRDNLPRDLYEATLDVMTKAVEKGFGLNYADGPLGAGLLDDFRQNINVFSAAKTYQQVNDISNFIMDEKGDKLPFAQFKAAADEIFETYNTNWLRTEQDTAFNLAQSARNWTDIEANKDVLPMVLFSTVGDGRVRDEHAEFDGICLPVDDPFWDEHTPLLDWNCRCIVTSHELEEYPQTTKEDLEAKDLPEIPLLFKGNPAKDGYIFDESVHPYFKVDQRYSISSQGVKTAIETPKIEKVIEPLITGGGFVPAKNVKEAEAYALSELGLKFASYKGVPIDIVNDMNKAIFETKNKFPKLKTSGIGSKQNLNLEIKQYVKENVVNSDYYKEYVAKYGQSYGDKLIQTYQKTYLPRQSNGIAFSVEFRNVKRAGSIPLELDMEKYNGIYLNKTAGLTKAELDETVLSNVKTGWFAKGGEDFGYIMTHELGHEIDTLLRFKETPEFKAIFKREHEKGLDYVSGRLSRYGATAGKIPAHRPDEMIAEAWAEYMHSNEPRELAQEIGKLIEKQYKNFDK